MSARYDLKWMNNPWAIVGLVVLAIEAVLCAVVFNMADDGKIIALSIFGALVCLSLVTVYAIERLRSTAIAVTSHRLICRPILSRRELYLECTRLINTCQSIRDTTWGRRARQLAAPEKEARAEYRSAVINALKSNKDYRELLSAEERQEFLEEAKKLAETFPNYEYRVLTVNISELSILDMMIGDSTKIIFSHVSAEDPQQGVQYLYVESEALSRLFLQFYSDCWQRSKRRT